jgi:hypothetical protein
MAEQQSVIQNVYCLHSLSMMRRPKTQFKDLPSHTPWRPPILQWWRGRLWEKMLRNKSTMYGDIDAIWLQGATTSCLQLYNDKEPLSLFMQVLYAWCKAICFGDLTGSTRSHCWSSAYRYDVRFMEGLSSELKITIVQVCWVLTDLFTALLQPQGWQYHAKFEEIYLLEYWLYLSPFTEVAKAGVSRSW